MIRAGPADASMGGLGTAFRTLLLALVAAASPMALTATIVVLKTRLARLNGLLFAGGFFLGEAIGWSFAILVGSAVLDAGDSTVAAVVELALGALLLATAWRVSRGEA